MWPDWAVINLGQYDNCSYSWKRGFAMVIHVFCYIQASLLECSLCGAALEDTTEIAVSVKCSSSAANSSQAIWSCNPSFAAVYIGFRFVSVPNSGWFFTYKTLLWARS